MSELTHARRIARAMRRVTPPKTAYLDPTRPAGEKRIAYLITDNGVDGRERTEILAAYWTVEERTRALEADPSKAWRHTEEKIVDVDLTRREALYKLSAVDRLLLSLPSP